MLAFGLPFGVGLVCGGVVVGGGVGGDGGGDGDGGNVDVGAGLGGQVWGGVVLLEVVEEAGGFEDGNGFEDAEAAEAGTDDVAGEVVVDDDAPAAEYEIEESVAVVVVGEGRNGVMP